MIRDILKMGDERLLRIAPPVPEHMLGTAELQQLIGAALEQEKGPTWLFCHPDLVPFYARLGFHMAVQLPETLAGRLQRYQRSKRLIALQRGQSSLSSSPGNSTSV